jgi:hypothetical protein
VDDATKLVLAPEANAALLADVLKARTQAGMSAAQLDALTSTDRADERIERERARRDADLERERRHQLELLALQNDVNKTALATQAQLGAALVAGAVCRHAGAQAGDRFCGTCGAPLPARG